MVNVKVYSTPTCPYCRMVEAYLTDHGIEFEVIDVFVNQSAAQEMIKKSGQMGVPVVDVDGEIIVGFDKPKIAQVLGIK